MKGQTSAFLDKSQELLNQAGRMLEVGGLTEAAGRTAYLAGFHAAQAFIFESIGRIYKTHSGVRSEFSRLLKDDPRIDDQLRGFLAMAYNLKEIADYETGPGSHVSDERALDGRGGPAVCRASPSFSHSRSHQGLGTGQGSSSGLPTTRAASHLLMENEPVRIDVGFGNRPRLDTKYSMM